MMRQSREHTINQLFLPIEGGLIRTVVEHLEELTSPEMEHKLRVDAEIVRESKACRIFLSVVGKFLAKSNQHSIQPS